MSIKPRLMAVGRVVNGITSIRTADDADAVIQVDAQTLGIMDAHEGYTCDPDRYLLVGAAHEAYIRGFKSARR